MIIDPTLKRELEAMIAPADTVHPDSLAGQIHALLATSQPEGDGSWWAPEGCLEGDCDFYDDSDPDVWPCSHATWVPKDVEEAIRSDAPSPAEPAQAKATWHQLVEAMSAALGCDVLAWRDHETGEWSANCQTCGCEVNEDGCTFAQKLATAADQAIHNAASPAEGTGEACPTCGKARDDLTPGPHKEGWGVCPESFHFRPAPVSSGEAGERCFSCDAPLPAPVVTPSAEGGA